MLPLRGSFWVLVLYDVAEQIDLEKLRSILGVQPARREPSFKHPTPEYVRFERPPVIEDCESISTGSGESLSCRVNYFDYGVVSVELELPFESDWPELVRLSSHWIASPDTEKSTLYVPARGSTNSPRLSLTTPPDVGPSWGNKTGAPAATVAALSGGMRA